MCQEYIDQDRSVWEIEEDKEQKKIKRMKKCMKWMISENKNMSGEFN